MSDKAELLQAIGEVGADQPETNTEGSPAWNPSSLEGVTSPDAGKVEELIPGLIPKGHVTGIGAEWKTCKTLLFYRATLDCITGNPVLGQIEIPGPINCMVVQFEMPEPEDLRRYRRLAIGAGVGPEEIPEAVRDGRLIHLSRPTINLANPVHAARFVEYVLDHDRELVLIDSYTAAFGGADLNSGGVVAELFSHAFDPLTSEGVTVVINNHKNKAAFGNQGNVKASFFGSQAFGARCSRLYALAREDTAEAGGDKLRRFVVRLTDEGGWTPDAEPERLIEVYDTPDDTGTVVQLLTTADQIAAGGITKEQRAKRRLAELTTRQPGIPQDDAMTQIGQELSASPRTMKNALRTAKSDRWVCARKANTGKAGRQPLVLYPGDRFEC